MLLMATCCPPPLPTPQPLRVATAPRSLAQPAHLFQPAHKAHGSVDELREHAGVDACSGELQYVHHDCAANTWSQRDRRVRADSEPAAAPTHADCPLTNQGRPALQLHQSNPQKRQVTLQGLEVTGAIRPEVRVHCLVTHGVPEVAGAGKSGRWRRDLEGRG